MGPIVVFLLIFVTAQLGASDEISCAQATFEELFVRPYGPLGMLSERTLVKKSGDHILIREFRGPFGLNSLKYEWDLRRAPVHVKIWGQSGPEVFKAPVGGCVKGAKGDFCHRWNDLKSRFEDVALIWAKGKKEDLRQAHGKAHCVMELLRRYADEGLVL